MWGFHLCLQLGGQDKEIYVILILWFKPLTVV